jgi:hypothetical protein
MNSTANSRATYPSESNVFDQIRSNIESKTLSKGARLLWIYLRTRAGNAGRVRYRAWKLAETIGSSLSQTKEYLRELEGAGWLAGIRDPGHCNTWVIFTGTQPTDRPGGSRNSGQGVAGPPATLKNRSKQKTLYVAAPSDSAGTPYHEDSLEAENGTSNVVEAGAYKQPEDLCTEAYAQAEPSPTPDHVRVPSEPEPTEPPPPAPDETEPTKASTKEPRPQKCDERSEPGKVFDSRLLAEILTLTNDHRSRRFWIGVVGRLPEEELRYGMSSLRVAMNESIISRPGAYLHSILKARNPYVEFSKRKQGATQPTAQSSPLPPDAQKDIADNMTVSSPGSPTQVLREQTIEPVSKDIGLRNCKIARMLMDHRITQAEAERLMNDPALELPGTSQK